MENEDDPQLASEENENISDLPGLQVSQPSIRSDLTTHEVRQGSHRGDKYVRIIRGAPHLLRRVAADTLRATDQVSMPRGGIARVYYNLKEFLFGKPLPTEAEKEERLPKTKALAVFSSDVISSSAYATEEIVIVLVLAGTLALSFALPIALAIASLLAIVAFSYRQTVHAYPQGGGAYSVARENLGTLPGLIAAAALLIGYALTVAVSIAAGTAAVTSAVPDLYPFRVPISLVFIIILTIINLRGMRESGTIFAVPTYLYIFSLTSVIMIGTVRLFLGHTLEVSEPPDHTSTVQGLSLFLLLRAFAQGSVAMTGTEAIANTVPSFKPPESKNAAITLVWMALIVGFFFVGLTFLVDGYGILPSEKETLISKTGRLILGEGIFYGIFQIATMSILVLAANTSYAGFPRLAFVMARDGYMPHQFLFRGERLAFSNGILVLGITAALLIMAFEGNTHALIPLYAVGVFLSFTLSQLGMVRHWRKLREGNWRRSLVINGIGATLTGVVTVVVGAVNFLYGAWIVFLLIPVFICMFMGIHRHYRRVQEQLDPIQLEGKRLTPPRQIVIVPVGDYNLASMRALALARSMAREVVVVRVAFDEKETEGFRQEWQTWGNGSQLVILESPFRSFNEPLLAYIDALHRQDPNAYVTVILPEFVPAHWWEHFLHNQTALRLKAALLFRRNTITINVPYHLER